MSAEGSLASPFSSRLSATLNEPAMPSCEAVIGDVAHADAVARAPRPPVTSSPSSTTPAHRQALPGDHLGEVLLAVAVDSGDAQGFTGAHAEGDLGELGSPPPTLAVFEPKHLG